MIWPEKWKGWLLPVEWTAQFIISRSQALSGLAMTSSVMNQAVLSQKKSLRAWHGPDFFREWTMQFIPWRSQAVSGHAMIFLGNEPYSSFPEKVAGLRKYWKLQESYQLAVRPAFFY